MPDFGLQEWILIGAGALVLAGLIIAVASRSAREQQEQEQNIRRSQTLRVVSIVALLALIVAFAVGNSGTVSVDWVFARTDAPMVVVIALSGGVGFLVGALVASRRSD